MKIKFLATGQALDSYEINGETIIANNEGKSEDIDLSPLEEGGQFQGVELEEMDMSSARVIRNAERKEGELHVILCQQTPVTKVSISFENFGRGCRITYTRFKEMGVTKGEPVDLKDEVNLKFTLKKNYIREGKSDKEAETLAKKDYEDFELIPSEFHFYRGGHWRKSDWIDADDYDPEQTYIKRID